MNQLQSMSSGTAAGTGAARARIAPRATRRRELEQKLAVVQNDYAELHAALFEAAQVHRHLCAPRRMRFGNFQVASEIFAVRQLPGDFFIAQENDRDVMIALGDVCGKGLAAGMWVTHVAGLIAMHHARNPEPRAIVAGMNEDFQHVAGMPLTTLFQARLDPVSGILDYCNAGHPPAFVLRVNGEAEELSSGGPLLGAMPTSAFAQGRVQLLLGDALVVYSDGILDSTNQAGEQFGHEQWEEHLRSIETTDADAMLLSLLGAVQDFAGGRPIADDMSLVVIRRDAMEAGRRLC